MSRHDGTSGAIGVDFALASSAVLILIGAIVDYGTMFAAKHAINYGLVKAARYAAVNSTTATVSSTTAVFKVVVTAALGSANAKNCSLSVSYPNGNSIGNTVVLSASYPWTNAFGIDALPAITLSASQTLTIEH